MSFVAIHFASGAAFFSGSACLLAGLLIVTYSRRKLLPPFGRLLILAGLFLIGASATPIPLWAWCVWGMALVLWVAMRLARAPWGRDERAESGSFGAPLGQPHATPCEGGERRGWNRVASSLSLVAVIAVTLAAVAWELAWQVPPRGLRAILDQPHNAGQATRLVVIGDSLSAEDFTEGGDPWPTWLARVHGIDVVNLAFSGATAASAAKRVTPGDVAGAVVLIEIGGNDVLGSASPAEFEAGLERLLTKVCARDPSGNERAQRDRSDNLTRPPRPPLAKGGSDEVPRDVGPAAVVMLELPLPPLYNRFGEIQRRLARRSKVILVPKRYFAGVLIGEQATLDGLHLSSTGHQKMANMVWAVLFGVPTGDSP